MDYPERYTKDARLTILKALAEEHSYSLNEKILREALATFGFNRNRAWVRDQLKVMVDLDAVTTRLAGSVMIALITRAGLDHVNRHGIIEGISRPEPEA